MPGVDHRSEVLRLAPIALTSPGAVNVTTSIATALSTTGKKQGFSVRRKGLCTLVGGGIQGRNGSVGRPASLCFLTLINILVGACNSAEEKLFPIGIHGRKRLLTKRIEWCMKWPYLPGGTVDLGDLFLRKSGSFIK